MAGFAILVLTVRDMKGWKHDDVTGGEVEFSVEANPMTGLSELLSSRRFWTLLLDVVSSFIIYFTAKYFAANLDDVKFVLLGLQPLWALIVVAFTVDDLAMQAFETMHAMHVATLNAGK